MHKVLKDKTRLSKKFLLLTYSRRVNEQENC